MRLSEAILLGTTLRGQIRGHLFGDRRSCALGAAAEAIGAKGLRSGEGGRAAL